jgi:hypothetical protein
MSGRLLKSEWRKFLSPIERSGLLKEEDIAMSKNLKRRDGEK